jgi:hypothetical protein
MDPTEFETVEGQARWRILRAMFHAAASQAHWIGTLSNWAPGTTGVFLGLVITNFESMSRYLPTGFQTPIFWFSLFSAVVGILIQTLWGTVQFQLGVDERYLSALPTEITQPGADPALVHRIITPVVEEFIKSRPLPFRKLAQCGKKKGEKDLVLVPKSAATLAQYMSVLLLLQYVLLGTAIFWPLGVATLKQKHSPRASRTATPALTSSRQTASPKPIVSLTPTAKPGATVGP